MLKYLLMALLVSSCAYLPENYRPEGIKPKKDPFFVSWTKAMDPSYETGNLPISLNSPVIYQGMLYVGNAKGEMNAFNLQNGRLIWKKEDNGAYHSSPVVYEDHLIYGNVQGRLYSRHLMSGKSNFEVDLGSSVETKPFIYKGRVFVQTREHKIYSLDASTGKVLWAHKRSVPFLTTIQRASRPVVRNNKLVAGFADGTVVAFSMEDGVVIWESKVSSGTKFVDVDSEPVFYKNYLLMGSLNGELVVLDPETGRLLRRLPYSVTRAPVVTPKGLVVGTANGEVVLLDDFFKEVRKVTLSDRAISGMSTWKGGLIVTTAGNKVHYVSNDDYITKDTFELGSSVSAVFGDIVKEDGYLAFLSSRNRLYVFR